MDPILAWLQATAAALAYGIVQPFAAFAIGGVVGGYMLGTAKNKTAFAEIARGLIFGIGAGLAVWAAQRLIIGGV